MALEPSHLAGRTVVCVGLGDLGGALAARCVAAGAEVHGVRRGAAAPAGVVRLQTDARNAEALKALPSNPDAVVICVTAAGADEQAYRAGYLDVARAVAERYALAPPGCVLWVSSTAVYGQGGGVTLDDSAPAQATNYRGEVMLEAEAALRRLPCPVTALRLSGIYGPGRLALLRRVLEGRGAKPEPLVPTNRIHREDAIGVLSWLLERRFAGADMPATVLGTDPTPTPLQEVLGWLAQRLEVTLTAGDDAGAAVGRGPARGADRSLLPSWLLGAGYPFVHRDFRSGYGAIIADLEASGELDALRRAAASG